MKDDELVDAFAEGTLVPADFHHREHVRLTWIYLTRFGRAETERRLLHGLRALAARAGKPEKFDSALTLAWIAMVDAARCAHAGCTFDELVEASPHLLERGAAGVTAPN